LCRQQPNWSAALLATLSQMPVALSPGDHPSVIGPVAGAWAFLDGPILYVKKKTVFTLSFGRPHAGLFVTVAGRCEILISRSKSKNPRRLIPCPVHFKPRKEGNTMPLIVNVGLSKKLGLPDYGSLGASCNVQFEADHGLLERDLAGFHQRVKNAFSACREAIGDELAHQQAQPNGNSASGSHTDADTSTRHAPAPSNGHGQPNGNGHRMSEKQLGYAQQLAKGISGLGIRRLESLAQKMYGRPLAALGSMDASGLIDTLKSIKAGEIDLDQALEGQAT
jgi:hypothetical protein